MNLYEILQVDRKASSDVIHAAWKALIKNAHPDKGVSADITILLNDAKTTLLDSEKREEYDADLFKQVGSIIGSYRVLEEIAQGGFGTTYKGEHVKLQAPVCIKHAHRISHEDEQILANEANAMWDLSHPFIPTVRDFIVLEDKSCALVTSYIPGPTLYKVIEKNKRIDSESGAWICDRVLQALRYLHYHGVVHGDVKPQNIIVQPEKHTAVLVDYGLSAIKPSHTNKPLGYTPYFASPEQLKKMPLLPESDFYSLGMTLIYALGGDVLKKTVPESVPKEFRDFIGKLTFQNALFRPSWEKENLVETLALAREKSFGRRQSNMKKLDY